MFLILLDCKMIADIRGVPVKTYCKLELKAVPHKVGLVLDRAYEPRT